MLLSCLDDIFTDICLVGRMWSGCTVTDPFCFGEADSSAQRARKTITPHVTEEKNLNISTTNTTN